MSIILKRKNMLPKKKLLVEGFKRSIYWNIYKVIDSLVVEIADVEKLLDSSYQEVKIFFFLLMIIQKATIKFLLILLKNIFFQELK